MKKESIFIRAVKNIDLWIAAAAMIFLVGLTFTGVIMRYRMNKPITWLEEVQFILIVWVAFFGASVAFRQGSHIAIEVVMELFPSRLQKIMEKIIAVLVFAVMVFIFFLELERGMDLTRTGRRTNILSIPLSINYFAVAFACLLMLINHAVYTLGNIFHVTGGADSE
jgi:TRAP-type C4-dicarboxylate transport system permease small subunit